MTLDNVLIVFESKIKGGDRINLPDGSFVDVYTFTNIFADAPTDPTYDDMMAIDGGVKGYKPFFDQCKDEGLLN